MSVRNTFVFFTVALITSAAVAQLPSDAINLGLLKISEKQKSTDLCPVYLVQSNPKSPTWEYKGMKYRGSKLDAHKKFMEDPDTFANRAKYKRWENNFISAMSIIWCPVTDEVNPGGGSQWIRLGGVVFESCCKFCDEDFSEEDFPIAMEALQQRAKASYTLTNGKYVEGARSPVEGAIRIPGLSSVVGVWDVEVDANGRKLTNTITFKNTSGTLAGTIAGQLGKAELKQAEVSEDGFSFVVVRNLNGVPFEAEYEGKQDKNEISGKVYVTLDGTNHEFKFTGKKQHNHEHHEPGKKDNNSPAKGDAHDADHGHDDKKHAVEKSPSSP